MKRILSLILCVFMTLSLETAVFGADEITIYVNGSVVRSEVKPVISDGNTLIPIRPVAEAMGCTVTWVAEEKGIKIESENIRVQMVIDSYIIYTTLINLNRVTAQVMSIPPVIINNYTYIPMRPMVEALGGEVSWDGTTKTVNITYDTAAAQSNYNTELAKVFFSINETDGVYLGEMSDGLRNGTGTLTWSNGDVYEGEFKNGAIDGSGTYTWANGTVYKGEWKNGTIEGYGRITGPDGSSYEGEWRNGVRNGQGKMTYADGTVEEGIWENDEFTG